MRINPASFLPHLKGLRFDHIEVSEGRIVVDFAIRLVQFPP